MNNMKKIFLTILIEIICTLFTAYAGNVSVYVVGVTSDGVDEQVCYWKNGNLCQFPSFLSTQDEYSFQDMAVEDGNIYSCFKNVCGYRSYCIYKNGELLYRFTPKHADYASYISDMEVMYGNIYVGLREYSGNFEIYSMVKNGNYNGKINGGRDIEVNNGVLYYTKTSGIKVIGYCAGGNTYEYPSNQEISVRRMRIRDNSVVLLGTNYEKTIPCTQFDHSIWFMTDFVGYTTCLDMTCDTQRRTYYLMEKTNRGREIIDGVSRENILSGTGYSPIAMEDKNGMLYILASGITGSLTKYYVLTYNMDTKQLYSALLPQCTRVSKLIVVEE